MKVYTKCEQEVKNMTIGEKLVELRGDTRMEAVCLACEISMSALYAYEHDLRIPRDETKKQLANYYKTSVGALFFNEKVHEM